MSSTAAFLASFASILIGAADRHGPEAGACPPDLLEGGSKEAIRLGAGFLSTLAALVIGLMIASAKNTYDSQNTNIRQLGTNAVLVDQMLDQIRPGSEGGAHPAAGNHPIGDRADLAGKHPGDPRRSDLHRQPDRRAVLQRDRRPQAGPCRSRPR